MSGRPTRKDVQEWADEIDADGQPYLLAVPANQPLFDGRCRATAQTIADQLSVQDWQRCSAGQGSKGPREYDWAVRALAAVDKRGWRLWLVVRRHREQRDNRLRVPMMIRLLRIDTKVAVGSNLVIGLLTAAECEGIGTRANFYDRTGVIRDMVQSHLLQLPWMTAMDPPVSYDGTSLLSLSPG